MIEGCGGLYIDKQANETGDKYIYLTFDAGYDNGNVTRIVDILNEKGIKGSFFILSNLVAKNPELVKKLFENGHLICNHSSTHKDATKVGTDAFMQDVERLNSFCYERLGITPTKYFRFPEGKYTAEALSAVRNAGYTPVFWSLSYADWDNAKQVTPQVAIKKLTDHIHPGAIVLLHPTSATNATILPALIDKWQSLGYSFRTLDEI